MQIEAVMMKLNKESEQHWSNEEAGARYEGIEEIDKNEAL